MAFFVQYARMLPYRATLMQSFFFFLHACQTLYLRYQYNTVK